ncbi:MAG: hypothetical protein FJ096_09900 [Deltaproteobacteria bacterium]|nr:hypothetical protein [Deltaproteobacteria bacterium]
MTRVQLRSSIPWLVLSLSALVACSDDDAHDHETAATTTATTSTGGAGGAGGEVASTGVGGEPAGVGGSGGGGGEAPAPNKAYGYYFSVDTATGKQAVTIVDPSGSKPVAVTLGLDDLDALTGPAGNKKGPAWGDSLGTADGARVFANASNADRVLVIDAEAQSVETVLKGGQKPLHLYEPNDNGELWSHNDTDGTFTVIDGKTLAVKSTLLVSQTNTGHGKLLYALDLGTQYFATITANPGIFAVDGKALKAEFVGLCGQPCVDDLATPADESKNTCGGTHDKTYDPATKTAIFQCSGVTKGKIALYDTAAKKVTKDLVALPVSAFAYTHDKSVNLVFDNATNSVGIWDATAAGHTLDKFDATVTIAGNASGRGTDFRKNDAGEWEAWIPQSAGSKLVVLNLATKATKEIEVGPITLSGGESARRGALAGDWFFTYSDAGIVLVDVKTEKVTTLPKLAGSVSRVNGALVPQTK